MRGSVVRFASKPIYLPIPTYIIIKCVFIMNRYIAYGL